MIGLASVLGTNAFIVFVVPAAYRSLTVAVTLAAALVFVVALRPRFYLTSLPSLVFWVPFLMHLYLLSAGLASGVILDPPILLLMGLGTSVIALYLHRPTIRLISKSMSL